MRRAALAGVETIEHGDGGTPEVFRLMKERGVAFCPTLSVAGPSSARKRASFKAALEAGVTIASGTTWECSRTATTREIELLVSCGMTPRMRRGRPPPSTRASCTSRINSADLIAVEALVYPLDLLGEGEVVGVFGERLG